MSADYDIVIRNGKIADGTGAELFIGDVAIANGRIAEVGTVGGKGREEIDATDRLVTPGFVDIHTHYDGQATWDNQLAPSSFHGVTTVVMGNCGVGFAPVRETDHEKLIELMEGIEDIPGTALHEGLQWNWETFEDYLEMLGGKSFDMDVAAQLPHGPLRLYVMGDRATRLEDATTQDVAQMRELARKAVEAGAVGFSTSRSINHKSVKGDLTPSYRAQENELLGIALGLRDAGTGVLQWISDFTSEDRDVEYAMIHNIVRESGRPMSISVGQTYSDPDSWRETLAIIRKGRAEGLDLRAQVAPRPIGVILGLSTSANPLQRYKTFGPFAGKPLAEQVAGLRDPAVRAAFLAEAKATGDAGFSYTRLFPLSEVPDYGRDASQSVAAIAEKTGKYVFEVIYDELLKDDGKALLFFAAANYFEHDFSAIREMIADPNSVMGLSDGGAHVGLISDSSFPTSLLAIWGRDAPSGQKPFDISELIRKQTSATAQTVGLNDRGVIAKGMKADINVIDLERLSPERPHVVNDLPAGGRRLLQFATGYDATIVSGQITYRDGVATGARPGRLVRGAQTAPA